MTREATPQVLVVEDEMMLMMMVEDLLLAEGYHVVAAGRLQSGIDAARARALDAAILDINLGGESAMPLADALSDRGVPFMFASGYGTSILPDRYKHCIMLQKPYLPRDLLEALSRLLDSREFDTAS
ncbi:MAG TPA: response regulator [Pseudoxanthomonas sp.]|nr:response regulator [Pseudoxanthomonas sp.]